jgi:hypothetical protein
MQSPWRIEWKQIETEHFTIIYPNGIEKDALYVANYMEHIYPDVIKTIGEPAGKTPIILNTTLAMTNGYSALAPRKSEWFNNPGQNAFGGTLGWYNMLGIHEYRHILQFDNLKKKTNFAVSLVFGEIGYSILINITTPQWFFEGDAVTAETLLTDSGRGRTPQFDVEFRAQLLSGTKYKYYKAMNGSYKDHVPLQSPYLLGYYMMTRMRAISGSDAIDSLMSKISELPLPYRYSHAVKSITGMHASELYESTMNELTQLWGNQLKRIPITPALRIRQIPADTWASYTHIYDAGSGKIVAFRTGDYVQSGIISYHSNTDREEMLVRTYPQDGIISYSSGKITWAESIPDVRWGMESYSDLFVMDMKDDSVKRLTRGGKLAGPSLSADGKQIVAVEFNESNKCSLVILDSDNGNEIRRVESRAEEYIRNPRFTQDGKSVIYESYHAIRGVSIVRMDIESSAISIMVPYTKDVTTNPVSDGKYIYYVSAYTGIDNIFALDLRNGKRYQVTSRPFGAYYPSISSDGTRILFSDVGAEGYVPSEVTIDPKIWIPFEKSRVDKVVYCEPLVKEEKGKSVIEDIPIKDYGSTDYSGFGRVLNIHSWYPFYNPFSRDISFTVLSNNIMSTVDASAGYVYNWNEKTHTGKASLGYTGIYPILDVSGIYGGRTSHYKTRDVNNNEKKIFYKWKEETAEGGIQFPFNFSDSIYLRNIFIGANARYTKIIDITHASSFSNGNGLFTPITYWFNAYNYDFEHGYVMPMWGQSISVSYSHTPGTMTDYKGRFISGDMCLYFPGILKRSNFYLEGGYEKQYDREYHYESKLFFTRGYKAEYHDELYKGSINYTLPLFYPDKNMWVGYLKRIFVNVFFDSIVGIDDLDRSDRHLYRSAGIQMMNEFNVLNIALPVNIGVQYAYLFDTKKDKRNSLMLALSLGYSG